MEASSTATMDFTKLMKNILQSITKEDINDANMRLFGDSPSYMLWDSGLARSVASVLYCCRILIENQAYPQLKLYDFEWDDYTKVIDCAR